MIKPASNPGNTGEDKTEQSHGRDTPRAITQCRSHRPAEVAAEVPVREVPGRGKRADC